MIHIYVSTFLYAGKVLLNILLFYTFVYICIFYIVRYLVHIPQVRHKFGWFEYFKHVVVSNVCKFRIKVAQWTKINFLALKTLMLGIYLILSMWLGLTCKKHIREQSLNISDVFDQIIYSLCIKKISLWEQFWQLPFA